MTSSLRKELDEIKKRINLYVGKHVTFDFNTYECILHCNEDKKYIPPPSGLLLHKDDSMVKAIKGPYGSGKSTTCIFDILKEAIKMPECLDGVRRSRFCVVRNTSGQLETTTLKTWLDWFGELGDVTSHKKPVLEYKHRFNDGNGIVEMELTFLALDREDDLRKLRSIEFSHAYINEASEVSEAVLRHLVARCGRYPAVHNLKSQFKKRIILDTNPPDTEHWIYKLFEEENPEQHKLFNQPPGLLGNKEDGYRTNPDAENIANLEKDYYLTMTYGASEEYIKVFAMGIWGMVYAGKPVYPIYNDDIHSADNVVADPELPLVLGFDFGLTPAVVVEQVQQSGRLVLLWELTSDNMGLRRFMIEQVMPLMKKEFPGFDIEKVTHDPAGNNRQETDESTCHDILVEYFGSEKVEGASTNALLKRLDPVEYSLSQLIDGKPAFVLSRENCKMMRKGFIGKYQYKPVLSRGKVGYSYEPWKNEFSHCQDAHQYVSMLVYDNNFISHTSSVDTYNPNFRLENNDRRNRR